MAVMMAPQDIQAEIKKAIKSENPIIEETEQDEDEQDQVDQDQVGQDQEDQDQLTAEEAALLQQEESKIQDNFAKTL